MYGNGSHCISQNDTVIQNINFWVDTIGGSGSNLGPGIYTSDPTSIAQNPDMLGDWVTVFPNPATDRMLLQFKNATSRPVNITLKNLAGQAILNKKNFNQNEIYFNSEQLSPGMYLLEVERNGNRYLNKIVFE
jgi:hypothetical protein